MSVAPKLPFPALFAVFLAGCAAQPPAEPLAISNLKYGTMCGAPDMHVCSEASDIAIDGTERCVYDRREIPCNWYGFSFDYSPKQGSFKIACDMAMDYDANMGNPAGVVSKDTKSFHYEVALSGGHFANPQYKGHEKFDGIQNLTETCSYRGQKLFEFALQFHYVNAPS